ncbi:MAG: hypothetical protein FWG70_06165 [Oscillospiraceae bacterium]|nr:hypothetical protein [Oscillospiraceae bacterium]
MLITDILAALSSGTMLVYSFLYIRFVLRLPDMITDTSLRAAERNVKLAIFIIMLAFILIALIKFIFSVGKIIYRLRNSKKNPSEEDGGFWLKSFIRSEKIGYKRFSVWLNVAFVIFPFSVLLFIFPNLSYEIGAGRTLETKNVYEHALWEMNWFFPMVQFFLILFTVNLIISILRLIIAKVNNDYMELYFVSQSRNTDFINCRACGFDNHISSVNCGDCGIALRSTPASKAAESVMPSRNTDFRAMPPTM